jgi:hypothetical protein
MQPGKPNRLTQLPSKIISPGIAAAVRYTEVMIGSESKDEVRISSGYTSDSEIVITDLGPKINTDPTFEATGPDVSTTPKFKPGIDTKSNKASKQFLFHPKVRSVKIEQSPSSIVSLMRSPDRSPIYNHSKSPIRSPKQSPIRSILESP